MSNIASSTALAKYSFIYNTDDEINVYFSIDHQSDDVTGSYSASCTPVFHVGVHFKISPTANGQIFDKTSTDFKEMYEVYKALIDIIETRKTVQSQ